MKMEGKRHLVIQEEEGEDDLFLQKVAEAEADALATKRRKMAGSDPNSITAPPPQISTTSTELKNNPVEDTGGIYTAALKGRPSVLRKLSGPDSLQGRFSWGSTNVVAAGANSGDSCFKCGKSGHWARDCEAFGDGGRGVFSGKSVEDASVADKACPCGSGACVVLTANTERNRGRKFYKCPLRLEQGGCGFFEWCDNSSQNNNLTYECQKYGSSPSYEVLQCPCGAGSCLILTAKTGKNIGQQFYRCPADMGSSCGFFKWCNEVSVPTNFHRGTSDVPDKKSVTNTKSHPGKTGSSCYKCGKEGHWAKDCCVSSSDSASELGGKFSSGSCYKCGKSGHWARNCSAS